MPRLGLVPVIVVVSLAAAAAQGQNLPACEAPPGKSAGKSLKESAERRYGRELLKIAEGDAGVLRGGMRAYALAQVAYAYRCAKPKKATALLLDAFHATLEMDDDSPYHTRAELQRSILVPLVMLDATQTEQLLPQVDPRARAEVLNSLIVNALDGKRAGPALELFYRVTQQWEAPYSAAAQIMENLPPERSGDWLWVFTVTLASYRAHSGPGYRHLEMAGVVAKFWMKLPQNLVHEAIDEILEQMQTGETKANPGGTYMLFKRDDSLAFQSDYELCLFVLLPVLRQIDESEAGDLLKRNASVSAILAKYPEGPSTLVGASSGTEQPGTSPYSSVSTNSPPSPKLMEYIYQQQRAEKFLSDAAQHPQDALANLATISRPDVRADGYRRIASMFAGKNHAVAESAITKMLESAESLQPIDEVPYVRSAAEIYLQVKQTDSARKMIERGLGLAEKLSESDADRSDPNQALKSSWPSTNAFRALLRVAARISPAWTLGLIKEISDPENRTIVELVVAATWLQAGAGNPDIMVMKKNTRAMRSGMEE